MRDKTVEASHYRIVVLVDLVRETARQPTSQPCRGREIGPNIISIYTYAECITLTCIRVELVAHLQTLDPCVRAGGY